MHLLFRDSKHHTARTLPRTAARPIITSCLPPARACQQHEREVLRYRRYRHQHTGRCAESAQQYQRRNQHHILTRGDLGAIQNRLEHTINNLGVTTENMTAAESRIRDTDMADEMMSYTKNNILVQAAQAMLAQANQVPQGVLQLLQ